MDELENYVNRIIEDFKYLSWKGIITCFLRCFQTRFLTDVHLIRACRTFCVKADFSRSYFEVVSKYVLMCELTWREFFLKEIYWDKGPSTRFFISFLFDFNWVYYVLFVNFKGLATKIGVSFMVVLFFCCYL